MTIAVFGASGKVGHEVLRQALDRGWTVVAFARNPGKIGFRHDGLTVVPGELADSASLDQAISGADCVISALGPGGKARDSALSDGVKNIVAAMERVGVKRLIQLATPSAVDPRDGKELRFRLMVALVRRMFPGAYAEIVRIAATVRASGLAWTLVRVPLLTEKPGTKIVRTGYPGEKNLKTTLSRADLAWFMLEQAGNDEYLRQAPMISH